MQNLSQNLSRNPQISPLAVSASFLEGVSKVAHGNRLFVIFQLLEEIVRTAWTIATGNLLKNTQIGQRTFWIVRKSQSVSFFLVSEAWITIVDTDIHKPGPLEGQGHRKAREARADDHHGGRGRIEALALSLLAVVALIIHVGGAHVVTICKIAMRCQLRQQRKKNNFDAFRIDEWMEE